MNSSREGAGIEHLALFDSPQHERLTRTIARIYEQQRRKLNPFYSITPLHELPRECQQEHAYIARAALAGGTYLGQQLPQWVINLAKTEGE